MGIRPFTSILPRPARGALHESLLRHLIPRGEHILKQKRHASQPIETGKAPRPRNGLPFKQ